MKKEILHVLVGSEDRPSDQSDIDAVEKKVKKALEDAGDNNTIVLATHHAVTINTLPLLMDDTNYTDINYAFQLFEKGLLTGEELKAIVIEKK